MSSLPSFERFSYAIRPNKNVERKLLAEALSGLQHHFDLSTYKYIGLGSMWFIDFVLFHKILRIDELVSIERENADRAKFNQPFGCITVKDGDTGIVLPELDLESKPLVVWLDYDGAAEQGVIDDIRVLAQRAPSGSILIVTVNASNNQFDSGVADPKDREAARVDRIREVFGDATPTPFPQKSTTRGTFPALLSGILFNVFDRELLKSGRKDGAKFERLFNISYSDNAPMITVGGMVANATDRARLSATNITTKFAIAGAQTQKAINVPPLTIKEKMAIDKLLPSGQLSEALLKSTYGFVLDQAYLDAYALYYRHYPVFSELVAG